VCVCVCLCVWCVSEKGFCVRGDLCEFDHGVDPVVIDDLLPGQPLPPHQPSAAAAAVVPPVTQTSSGSAVVWWLNVMYAWYRRIKCDRISASEYAYKTSRQPSCRLDRDVIFRHIPAFDWISCSTNIDTIFIYCSEICFIFRKWASSLWEVTLQWSAEVVETCGEHGDWWLMVSNMITKHFLCTCATHCKMIEVIKLYLCIFSF